ncbi:MAG: PQQ-like beta-propeller repeat protein [Gammaproteobacteria bacterium]|nr:PQQ-like beta-propeller repeat protein [Gammaproteobacteria bacterium]
MHRLIASILMAASLLPAIQSARAGYPTNPVLVDDSIYVSRQGIYKFDQNQSEPLWSSLQGIETFEPVIHEALLLVGSTQGLYALELETGSIAWHIEKQHTLFTPSISTWAFAGSLHGTLYAIDPERGDIIWRSQFPGWIYSPVINEATTMLWTGGQDHSVYAVSAADGSLEHDIEATQELVFSPVDLGNNQIAVNLFDGNTLVIAALGAAVSAVLEGDSQPINLQHYANRIYRSHRDGTLSVFDRNKLEFRSRKSLVTRDLSMHPSQPGYLLLSDRDRKLILLDLGRVNIICHLQPEGQWVLPLQINAREILFFRKLMKPPGLALVKNQAQCK